MLLLRSLPKSRGYWNPGEPIGTGSSTGFLADMQAFPWVLKAIAAFPPTSHRSLLGEVIATPQTTQLPITGAGEDTLWGEPPELPSRFDPQGREQMEDKHNCWLS